MVKVLFAPLKTNNAEIFFCVIRPRTEPMVNQTQRERINHYTTETEGVRFVRAVIQVFEVGSNADLS